MNTKLAIISSIFLALLSCKSDPNYKAEDTSELEHVKTTPIVKDSNGEGLGAVVDAKGVAVDFPALIAVGSSGGWTTSYNAKFKFSGNCQGTPKVTNKEVICKISSSKKDVAIGKYEGASQKLTSHLPNGSDSYFQTIKFDKKLVKITYAQDQAKVKTYTFAVDAK